MEADTDQIISAVTAPVRVINATLQDVNSPSHMVSLGIQENNKDVKTLKKSSHDKISILIQTKNTDPKSKSNKGKETEMTKVPHLVTVKSQSSTVPVLNVSENKNTTKNNYNMIYVYDFSKMLPHPGRIEKAVCPTVPTKLQGLEMSKAMTDTKTTNSSDVNESHSTPIANQMVLDTTYSHTSQLTATAQKDNVVTMKCAYCDYTSHNKNYLKQHVDLVHTADRPYKCPFCDYAGKRSHSLREHLIVHSNDRPFQCSHCNATFRKKGHLTNHEKLHQKTVNCQICQMSFPSSDIELHLKEHHRKKESEESSHTSKEFADKASDAVGRVGAEKVYVCSECKKMFKDFSQFIEHAKIHSVKESKEDEIQNQSKNLEKTLKVMKCSECGYVSSDQNTMTKHLWTHINKDEHTLTSTTKPLQNTNVPRSGDHVQPQDSTSKPQITTVSQTADVPEKSSFKCDQCGIVCSEAYSFVQHMTTHKAERKNICKSVEPERNTTVSTQTVEPRMQYHKQSLNMLTNKSVVLSSNAGVSLSSQHFQVIKHANDHPGKEQEIYVGKCVPSVKVNDLPFVQDNQSARFRCTICGYTCEYQRTIKAHIWKHSGNKDIDYPIFQNGPLSIYDDWTPYVVEESKSHTGKEIISSSSCKLQKDNVVKEETERENTQRLCASVEAIKVKSAISPVAPALANLLAMRAKLKAGGAVSGVCEEKTGPEESENLVEAAGEIEAEKLPEVEISEATVSVEEAESMKGTSVEDHPVGTSVLKRKLHSSSTEEDGEMQQVAKRFCSEDLNNSESKGVVVEPVATFASDLFTGLRSEMNSPKTEDCSQDNDSGVASESIGSPNSSVVTRAKSRKLSMKGKQTDTRDDITESDNDEIDDNPLTIDIDASSTRPSRERTMSASMTESAVTLLSLLQKGPNFNPACPIQPADVKQEGNDTTDVPPIASDKKSSEFGISSSLLAVIEQLRERSKESDMMESEETTSTKKVTKRKIKRESRESRATIEGIDNVEKLIENNEDLYRCKLCHYKNSSSFVLLQHMRLHKEKKPSECSLCEFVASSSEDLQDHMIKHCKVRTYQCKLCPSAFNYKSQLRAHMRAHNDKEVFVCDECDFESNNPAGLRNHMRGHSEKKIYKCEVCDKSFLSKIELKSHKKGDCAKQRSFSCDECGFVAIGLHEQRVHAKIHAKEFNCAYCEYVTTSITKFQNHTKMHEEQTSLKCELCDFPAVSTRSLKSHMKRHINDQRFVQQPLEQYKCNLCGYVCHHLPSLKSHMWRHASDATYSYQFTNEVINAAIDYDCRLDAQGCKESDIKEFSQTIRTKLKERLSRHGEIGDADLSAKAVCWVTFRCCQCGFETINKAQLSMHMKTHSDVIKWTLQVSSI